VQNLVEVEVATLDEEGGAGEAQEVRRRIALDRRMIEEHRNQDNERRSEEVVAIIVERAERKRWQGG
jgi:hypothetical protein